MLSGRFDFACESEDVTIQRQVVRSLAQGFALIGEGLHLSFSFIDLRLNIIEFRKRFFLNVGPCVQRLKFAAQSVALCPRISNAHRDFDRFGFELPLFSPLFELFDFVLLVSAMDGEFTPTSASLSQLLDFIAKSLPFREHRLKL